MLEMLERITQGEGKDGDIEALLALGKVVKDTAMCGLGQTAPNPIISTISNFKDEYEAHIKDHRCPAGICRALTVFEIDASKCIGCTLCAKNCPVEAITGERKAPHSIDVTKCIGCGVCRDNCRVKAIHPIKREVL
jgi:formate hydrogenlyase subunit 6/NADH:ubiquinone oxidoreductase subunit I